MQQPEHQQTQPYYEPDPQIWNMAVDFMQRSSWSPFRPNAMWLMENLSSGNGQAMLRGLDYNLQRQLFEKLAEDDPYETLNYSFLYKDKPFGMDILKKIALKNPDLIIEKIAGNPEDPLLQRLHRFLLRELGKERIKQLMKARESSLFRWFMDKILGTEEKTDEKPS